MTLALFVVTILSRLPFASQTLYHWDSVNMAFGLRAFDVQAGAPQYPGYIVYIALGQLIDRLFHDPQQTMLTISIISSGLAAAALYKLGCAFFRPTTGLIAAVFLITSPLVWFYGEIALPHALDLFAVTLAVWLLYQIMQGSQRLLWITALLLALIGGFRQQNLLFLGPLILFAIYRHSLRQIILFITLGFLATLGWFIPLIHNTGGLQNYLIGSSAFSNAFFSTTSLLHGAGVSGIQRNVLHKLLPYTLYAGALALLPGAHWLIQLPQRWRAALINRKVWFVMLWIGPALTFYAFIHMGQQGLVFVFLPAVFLLSAEGLVRLCAAHPRRLWFSTGIIAAAGTLLFIFGPEYPLGSSGPRLLTYETIRSHDQQLQHTITTIRTRFSPADTVILASGWRFVEYYLPEYALARLDAGAKWEVNAGQVIGSDFTSISQDVLATDQDSIWHIVLFDTDLAQRFAPEHWPLIQNDTAGMLYYLTLQPNQQLILSDSQLAVAPQR
jgi:hypothetical protein